MEQDPNSEAYDASAVQAYFSEATPEKAGEFVAWRNFWFGGQPPRCDNCYIVNNAHCDPSSGSCFQCYVGSLPCQRTATPVNTPAAPAPGVEMNDGGMDFDFDALDANDVDFDLFDPNNGGVDLNLLAPNDVLDFNDGGMNIDLFGLNDGGVDFNLFVPNDGGAVFTTPFAPNDGGVAPTTPFAPNDGGGAAPTPFAPADDEDGSLFGAPEDDGGAPSFPADMGQAPPFFTPGGQGGVAPAFTPGGQGGDLSAFTPGDQGGGAPAFTSGGQGGGAPAFIPGGQGGGAPAFTPGGQGGTPPLFVPEDEMQFPEFQGPGGDMAQAMGNGKGAEILYCTYCTSEGLDCDIHLALNYGCTNCRKTDQGCQYIEGSQQRLLAPRPDGLVPPMCCDACLGFGIQSCSWRNVFTGNISSPCENCAAQERNSVTGQKAFCTYFGIRQEDMNPRVVSHFTLTQNFSHPRPPHLHETTANPRPTGGAPRADGVDDNPVVMPYSQSQPTPSPYPSLPSPGTLLPQPTPGPVPSQAPIQSAGDADLMTPRRGGLGGLCFTCEAIPQKNGSLKKRCNWIDGKFGCDTCTAWKLLCVVDGVILPPKPLANVQMMASSKNFFTSARRRVRCHMCVGENTRCDRQRPCDTCVLVRGDPDGCTGMISGIFARGGGIGVECYPYLSRHGGGLQGLNDPEPFPKEIDMPLDFHLQYNNWLAGGPFPVPPGVLRTNFSPLRPHQPFKLPPASGSGPGAVATLQPSPPMQPPHVQPLPFGNVPALEQPQEAGQLASFGPPPDIVNPGERIRRSGNIIATYRQIWNIALHLYSDLNLDLDLTALRNSLRYDLHFGRNVPTSPGIQMVTQLQASIQDTAYVRGGRVPFFPRDQDYPALDVKTLALGAAVIFNASEFPRAPLSPVPTVTIFPTPMARVDVTENVNTFPYGHPERAKPEIMADKVLQRPDIMESPALLSVPSLNPFEGLEPSAHGNLVCLERLPVEEGNNLCLQSCSQYCVDRSHTGNPEVGVCLTCDSSSRGRFQATVEALVPVLRSHACSQCILNFDWTQFREFRLQVWGYEPANLSPSDAFHPNSSTFRPKLPYTGCSCAQKILDRTLCSAHRLEHCVFMRTKAMLTKEYIAATWGRQMCPLCLVRVGTDAYNFKGAEGSEGLGQLWLCLSCHGIVIDTNFVAPDPPAELAELATPAEFATPAGVTEDPADPFM